MRRCFLHMGTHKTGTTAIQHLLSRNRSALEKRGYFYPPVGWPELLPGHHNVAWEISGDRRFQSSCGTIDDLIREIRHRPDDIILSSEDFECSLHNRPAFTQFVSLLQSCGLDTTVILYVRSQADYLPRIYLTLLYFCGLGLPFDVVLDQALDRFAIRFQEWIINFDYCDVLARIAEIENVKIVARPYEPSRTSICRDFLSVLNLTLGDLGVDGEVVENVSLPLKEYVAMFLKTRMGRPLRKDEEDAVEAIVPRGASRIEVSPATKLAVFRAFRDTNRRLFTQYGIPEPLMKNVQGTPEDPHTPYIDELFSDKMEIYRR